MSKRGEIFTTAPVTTPNKSSFDMSSDNLYSCSAGTIVPHNVVECMAGDNLKYKTQIFGRVAPMLAPVFGKVDVITYDFYVRYRDIWPDFDEFITNQSQDDSVVSSEFVAPLMPKVKVRDLLLPYNLLSLVADSNLLNETEDGYFNPISYSCTILKVVVDKDHNILSFDEIYPYEIYSTDGTNRLIPFDETTGIHVFWFTLMPNRADYLRMQDYLNNYPSIVDGMQDAKYCYNYLSNGELSDMLGIDMTAYYVKQANTYIDNLITALTDFRSTEHKETALYLQSRITELINAIGDRVILSVAYNYEQDFDFQVGVNSVSGISTQTEGLPAQILANITALYESVDYEVSLLPFFAYNFIYDEWFRDQNYIDKSVAKKLASGAISLGTDWRYKQNPYFDKFFDFFTLRRKAYMHDPYTSALPKAQRGEPVRYLTDASIRLSDFTSSISAGTYKSLRGEVSGDSAGVVYTAGAAQSNSAIPSENTLVADLSAATIENFRWANSMQRYLEAVNRTGGRYYEYMKGIFGVEIPDSKINRPIYLNGNRTPIQISEVLQTSSTDIESQQALGDMAGRGIVVGSDESINYDVPDWGLFFQLSVVVPRTSYMTGLNPMFTRETYLDYPIPQFAQLGEEYARTSELWFDGSEASVEKPFGYQSRYYQWKYRRDENHSNFKSNLDFWTWSRKFSSEPVNGKEFLEIDPDYRQFAVTDKGFDHYYLYVEHNLEMLRPLPTFGVPTL